MLGAANNPQLIFVVGSDNPALPEYMVLDVNPNAFDTSLVSDVVNMADEYTDLFGTHMVRVVDVPVDFHLGDSKPRRIKAGSYDDRREVVRGIVALGKGFVVTNPIIEKGDTMKTEESYVVVAVHPSEGEHYHGGLFASVEEAERFACEMNSMDPEHDYRVCEYREEV